MGRSRPVPPARSLRDQSQLWRPNFSFGHFHKVRLLDCTVRHFTTDVSTFVEVTGTKPKMVGEYSDRQPLIWTGTRNRLRYTNPGEMAPFFTTRERDSWNAGCCSVSRCGCGQCHTFSGIAVAARLDVASAWWSWIRSGRASGHRLRRDSSAQRGCIQRASAAGDHWMSPVTCQVPNAISDCGSTG